MLNETLNWKGVKIKGRYFRIEEVRKTESDGYQYIQLENQIALGIYSTLIRQSNYINYIYSTKDGSLTKKDVVFVL